MAQTTVRSNLLQSLEVNAHLLCHLIRVNVAHATCKSILPAVQEPRRDVETLWIFNDRCHFINLICRQLTRSLVLIDIRLLANKVGKSPANTLDLAQRKHDLRLPIDIRIQNTKNVLEVFILQVRHDAVLVPTRRREARER